MRGKIPDLTRACAGRFADQHALMCTLHLGAHRPPHRHDRPAGHPQSTRPGLPFRPANGAARDDPGDRCARRPGHISRSRRDRFPKRRTWRSVGRVCVREQRIRRSQCAAMDKGSTLRRRISSRCDLGGALTIPGIVSSSAVAGRKGGWPRRCGCPAGRSCRWGVRCAPDARGAHQRVLSAKRPRTPCQSGLLPRICRAPGREHAGHARPLIKSSIWPRRDRGQLRGHRVDLDPRLRDLGSGAASSLVPRHDGFLRMRVSSRIPRSRGGMKLRATAHIGQLRQPTRVKGIAFCDPDILDMSGVDQQHLSRPMGLAQGMKTGRQYTRSLPLLTMRDTLGDPPSHHLDQRRVVGVNLGTAGRARRRARRGWRTATAIIFFPDVDRGRPARSQLHLWLPRDDPQARRPRNPLEHQESGTRARKGGNPEYQPGRAPASILWYRAQPRAKAGTTVSGRHAPEFHEPAERCAQRASNLVVQFG